jgi:hypothetical protein
LQTRVESTANHIFDSVPNAHKFPPNDHGRLPCTWMLGKIGEKLLYNRLVWNFLVFEIGCGAAPELCIISINQPP